MKQIKRTKFIAIAFTMVVASCHKDKITSPVNTPAAQRAGIYVLNQGSYGDNNASLTFYNYSTKALTTDLFSTANGGAKLGDVANDVGIYGSKMYIVVNNSNKVDIVNAKTGVLIKSDSLYQCRSVVFYKSNAYITSYNGTVAVMDTASLTINSSITVGADPEQMAIVGSKLYVANSGGLNTSGNPATTVSVVDLTTEKQTKQITVIADPVSMTADTLGHVYVLSLGNFADLNPGMTIIDDQTDAVLSSPTVSLGYNVPVATANGFVYYPTADNKIAMFNAKTQTLQRPNFITDGTVIMTPYAIGTDYLSGEVFVTDAVDY